MRRSISFRKTALAGMVLASIALGHELIYLLAHGPGEGYAQAMAEGGHDRYWTTFLLTVVAVVGALTLAALTQLLRLRHLAAKERIGQLEVRDSGLDDLARIAGRVWLRVAVAAVVVYVVQENLETASVGAGLPLHHVLLGEHAIALPVLLVVSLVVAVIGALFAWRRNVYLARLRASRPPHRARLALRRPAESTDRPAIDVSGRRNGVRAPPAWVHMPG